MNYHLTRNGKNEGIFSLEELQKRRATGELTGTELIWCEGMANWQPLSSILPQSSDSGVAPPRLRETTSRASRSPVLLLSIGGFLLVAVLVLILIKQTVGDRSLFPGVSRIPEPKEVGAMAIASKPIVFSEKAITEKEVTKKAGDFRRRQWLEGYKQRGERKPSYDAEALGFLENWIASNYGGEENTNLPPLTVLSDNLAANPDLQDPLILTVTALNALERQTAVNRLERAVAGFGSSKHKGYVKFNSALSLAQKLINKKTDRLPVLDGAALAALGEAFRDGSLLPDDQSELAQILIKGWGENFFNRNAEEVCQLAEAQGNAFKWLALVLRAEFEISQAWKARGGGYSNTVSEKGWALFRKHLGNARANLTAATELHPDLPLAPARMIYVCLGETTIEEMRLWFDRAVAAQIDYPSAWADMRWGLRPRWYGDLDSMLAFGIMAANTKRFDTDVPRMLFDVVTDLESELKIPKHQHIYGREEIWPAMQQMYEGYIAEPSQSHTRDGWRTTFAVVSYFAGKYDVAAEQFEALGWKWVAANYYGWGKDLSIMPLEVAARTGKLGKRVAEAEAFRDRSNFSKALQLYTELHASAEADERTRAFIEDRLATLAIEQQLSSRDWVDFLPTGKSLAGWTVTHGKCDRLADGLMEVQSDADGHLLYSRARVGADFEAKGSFEIVRTSTGAFQGGLVMGLPEYQRYSWNAFRIKRNDHEGEISSFSQHWTTKQIIAPVKLSGQINSFVLRCQNGKVSASVNDVEVFKEVQPPPNSNLPSNEFLLGLGAFNDMNDTVLRYRDLKVRKL